MRGYENNYSFRRCSNFADYFYAEQEWGMKENGDVSKLEKDITLMIEQMGAMKDVIEQLEQENKKLREALEYIQGESGGYITKKRLIT